jgi:hypothetical protein
MKKHSIALHIEDGIHHGAVIGLAAQETWTIGSDVDADILLVDEGVESNHARLDLAEKDGAVGLTAEAEGVAVFGQPLSLGRRVALRPGSAFAIGPVNLRLACMGEDDADEASGDRSARIEAAAKRHALRQLSRWAYVRELIATPRWGRIIGYALPSVLVAGALAWLLLGMGRRTAADHARALEYIGARFPDVVVQASEPTGVTTYTGYVEGHGELGELRTLALAADQGRSVIQVIPMETLAWNARQILEEFYADPAIRIAGAGTIEVTLSAPGSVKRLEGWDFHGVAQRLRQDLPELRQVDIRMAERGETPVAVGWPRGPYSVVSTRNDTYFAITESGERIFDGAVSGEGVVKDVSPCGLIIDPEQGKYFRFDFSGNAAGAYCGK